MTSQFRRERHSVTDLKIHLVCVTKYRRSVFTADGLEVIEKSFREVAKKMDFQMLEFNGEGNHVHALIEYPPKLAVSTRLKECLASWTGWIAQATPRSALES